MVTYRFKVIKQADIVLAMFLFGQAFPEQKTRNFDYYDPLTTDDSSLSSGIQSFVPAEIGYPIKAVKYAREALQMDLGDVGGNVKNGCHSLDGRDRDGDGVWHSRDARLRWDPDIQATSLTGSAVNDTLSINLW